MKPLEAVFFVFVLHFLLYLPVKANNNWPTNATETAEESTLKLVHVLFRHGIRTPVNTYANDPYRNETFYPFGWGYLTSDGKRDLFEMGQWLASRYRNFVDFYNPDVVYARSTSSPRTLMSMSTLLAGMFPPKNTPMEWNSNINWQPIPIFSVPLDKDITLRMQTDCEAYTLMKNRVETIESPDGIFQELTDLTGDNVTSAHDVNSIFITLWAEQLYGLPLPSWSSNYFPDKMRFMAEQSYADLVATKEMQRLKAGPFLELITQQMLKKGNETLEPTTRKLFLYCAHDWSITNILIALNVWKREMPDFAALILIELHQNAVTQEFFVEFYYQNGPHSDLEPLTLPGCSFQCSLNTIVELWQEVLPTASYQEMCKV